MRGRPQMHGSASFGYAGFATTSSIAAEPLFCIGRVSRPGAFLIGFALISLTACKPVGPNYNRPGYSAPSAYKETGASAVVVPPPNPARRRLAASQPF